MYISALLSLAKFMRRTQAATIIQKYRRMYVEKKRYRQKQAAALAMQTILRAYMARQKYQAVRRTSQSFDFKNFVHLLPYSDFLTLPSTETPVSASTCALISYFFCCTVFVSVAAAGAQGGDHSEARPWLVGSLLVQALPRVHRLPAVLHPQDEGQARVEEAED